MIGVVDYRAGNAPSVMYALARLGLEARLVADADGLGGVDHLILPGVGAARATLESLADSGLVEPMRERVMDDRIPFLGICIGLQVLFERSSEGRVDCLGWLRGEVRRFDESKRVPADRLERSVASRARAPRDRGPARRRRTATS